MENKTIIYFDNSDPHNTGITYRTRHEDGSEDSGPVDGLAGAAAEALIAGERPSEDGLADLRSAYGPDVVLDGVGKIFPGWEEEAHQYIVTDGTNTWTEEGCSADDVAEQLSARSRAEAGYECDMPPCDVIYEIMDSSSEILRTITVTY